MSVKTILEQFGHWVTSLFTTAEGHFNALPLNQQQAILNGSAIPQIIKTNLDAGETEITGLIIQKTGLQADTINSLLQGLYKQFNVATLAEYQALLKSATGTFWATLLEGAAKFLAGVLSGGVVTWESLGLGLLTYAYNTFIKGN